MLRAVPSAVKKRTCRILVKSFWFLTLSIFPGSFWKKSNFALASKLYLNCKLGTHAVYNFLQFYVMSFAHFSVQCWTLNHQWKSWLSDCSLSGLVSKFTPKMKRTRFLKKESMTTCCIIDVMVLWRIESRLIKITKDDNVHFPWTTAHH